MIGKIVKCPVCDYPLVKDDDNRCLVCKRQWVETGNAEAPLISKRRKVRLVKRPQKGDRLDDVVKPLHG